MQQPEYGRRGRHIGLLGKDAHGRETLLHSTEYKSISQAKRASRIQHAAKGKPVKVLPYEKTYGFLITPRVIKNKKHQGTKVSHIRRPKIGAMTEAELEAALTALIGSASLVRND